MRRDSEDLSHIGWREWVALPDLEIDRIKVKVDTGARSSALHASQVETFRRGRRDWVRFQVHPLQRDSRHTVEAEAPLLEWRRVKDSGGSVTKRPVILTPIRLLDEVWEIELTLVARDEMGFRMLLGRQAVRDRFVVDPGRSYFGGKPKLKKRRKTSKPRKAAR